MPKVNLGKSPQDTMNRILLTEISRGMTFKDKPSNEVGQYAGFSRSGWYCRKHDPGSFRLDELRRIFDSLKTSNETILAIFGRNP